MRRKFSADYLREILDYNHETGDFTWRRASKHVPWLQGKKAGSIEQQGYWVIVVNKVNYKAHILAWLHFYGSWPSKQLDHANGIRHDNRIANLREATAVQNQHNRGKRPSNKSGYKGVYWATDQKKWRATICVNRKRHYLGDFKTPELAAQAYQEAANKFLGEFAHQGEG